MNEIELYEAWAPEGAPWSPWVKPVLFAAGSAVRDGALPVWQAAQERARTLWKPAASSDTALVLDLPGPLALALALECGALGWRPVPLFNSCTGPEALVDNEPLRAGLVAGAGLLGGLAAAAAPAFVLDANRTAGQAAPKRFDNRWIVFPQDFPSAARLLASGLRRVCLVQEGRRDVRSDLAHVLLRWQQAGLEILAIDVAGTPTPEPLAVKKPSWFHALGYLSLIHI